MIDSIRELSRFATPGSNLELVGFVPRDRYSRAMILAEIIESAPARLTTTQLSRRLMLPRPLVVKQCNELAGVSILAAHIVHKQIYWAAGRMISDAISAARMADPEAARLRRIEKAAGNRVGLHNPFCATRLGDACDCGDAPLRAALAVDVEF